MTLSLELPSFWGCLTPCSPQLHPRVVSAQERSQEVGSSAAHAGPSPALRFWCVTGADPGERVTRWLQLCGILVGLSVLCLGFSGVLLLNPPTDSGLSPARGPGCFHYCIPLSVSVISPCLCPSSVSHWASWPLSSSSGPLQSALLQGCSWAGPPLSSACDPLHGQGLAAGRAALGRSPGVQAAESCPLGANTNLPECGIVFGVAGP